MSKLLFINGSPRNAEKSYSLRLAQSFLEMYEKADPENKTTVLNLYELNIPFITEKIINSLVDSDSSLGKTWVSEFKDYDRYLIFSPAWNLAPGAILKAYIDFICVRGETFVYDEEEQSFIGLLKNKKMVVITTKSQFTTEDSTWQDMNFPYIKQIFSVMGVENITCFEVEENVLRNNSNQQYFNVLKSQIEILVKNF